MLTAKPGGSGYVTGCGRTDPFQVGTAESAPAAGGYVFHQLTLFDVVGHHLVAHQRVVAYWLAREVLAENTTKNTQS